MFIFFDFDVLNCWLDEWCKVLWVEIVYGGLFGSIVDVW